MVEQMRDGDELWQFRSTVETWANMAARAGYCLVRDGKVAASRITLMNRRRTSIVAALVRREK